MLTCIAAYEIYSFNSKAAFRKECRSWSAALRMSFVRETHLSFYYDYTTINYKHIIIFLHIPIDFLMP